MNDTTQHFYGASTAKVAFKAEGRFRTLGIEALHLRIGALSIRVETVVQAMWNEWCGWSPNMERIGGPRQAYLLSELRGCAAGRKLLRMQGASRLVKLTRAVGNSIRAVWRWC